MNRRGTLLHGLGCVFLLAAAGWLILRSTRSRHHEEVLAAVPVGLDALLPVPPDNRLSQEKVELGRRLFHDARLSGDSTVSCASCHRPELAFTDGRKRAIGIDGRIGRRNTPSLFNVAYRRSLFWDGRARTLEEQALLPIENQNEMAHSVGAVLAGLRSEDAYVSAFEAAFGERRITRRHVAGALATYMRTIVAGDTPFDRDSLGAERPGLSVAARRGLALFEGRARCRFCHEGLQFTDDRFHNTGVGWDGEPTDLGRFEVTGRQADRGRFRTPTLRGLAQTAPYMHDGSFATLPEVVEFYDRGAGPNPHLDAVIRPLGLSAREKADLVAFLESLSAMQDER